MTGGMGGDCGELGEACPSKRGTCQAHLIICRCVGMQVQHGQVFQFFSRSQKSRFLERRIKQLLNNFFFF